MFYVIVILATIFAMPVNALDGTRLPANVQPVIPISPGNNPYADFTLQRGAADLLAQANPGGATLKQQLVGAWSLVSCTIQAFPWCLGPHDGIAILDATAFLGEFESKGFTKR